MTQVTSSWRARVRPEQPNDVHSTQSTAAAGRAAGGAAEAPEAQPGAGGVRSAQPTDHAHVHGSSHAHGHGHAHSHSHSQSHVHPHGPGGVPAPENQPERASAATVRSARQRHASGGAGLQAALQGQLLPTPDAASPALPAVPRRGPGNVQRTPGFEALERPEQERLMRYAAGSHPLARRVSPELQRLVTGRNYRDAQPGEQANMLRDFMRQPPPLVTAYLRGTGREQPHTLHGPTDVPNHAFRSGAAAAQRYEVEVAGRRVPVYVGNPPGANAHSITEVAKGLSTLAPAALDSLKHVQVNPGQNPDDAHWARVYNTPNFRSYMTAGAAGVIDLYPPSGNASQAQLSNSLVHEVGHIVSQRNFGTNYQSRDWSRYQSAIAADGVSPSRYAMNSPGEDFSEFLTLVTAVRGTPQEAELRALMPNRFEAAAALLP